MKYVVSVSDNKRLFTKPVIPVGSRFQTSIARDIKKPHIQVYDNVSGQLEICDIWDLKYKTGDTEIRKEDFCIHANKDSDMCVCGVGLPYISNEVFRRTITRNNVILTGFVDFEFKIYVDLEDYSTFGTTCFMSGFWQIIPKVYAFGITYHLAPTVFKAHQYLSLIFLCDSDWNVNGIMSVGDFSEYKVECNTPLYNNRHVAQCKTLGDFTPSYV